MITLDFEKRGDQTLTDFLYNSIKNQIQEGLLSEKEKLPSKRALSQHLGISVITVQNAYSQLIDEGYIFSIEKKGFFVSDIARHLKKTVRHSEEKETPAHIQLSGQVSSQITNQTYFADFTSNAALPGTFPFSLWSRTMRQVLSSENEKLLKRTDVFGALELRRAICHHLKAFRNMDISENQVIIGAGTESLYSMLVQFLGRDDVFAVENPGYHKAAEIFKLNGTKCQPVNIDEHGIIVEELQKINANVVHVSPSHHFPSGVIMNFKRRTELLDWAYSCKNHFIIEDDYDSEFRFTGKPLPTLQSIDQQDRVIYINTFSKTLSPSFRISYMILPQSLAIDFSKKLGFYSCQVSSFEQFTLARFIEEGHYEKHINRMKNYYRSLRNNLITAIENSELSKVFSIHEEDSGLHFLLTIRPEIKHPSQTAREIQKKWRQEGINIFLLSEYFYDKKKLSAAESFVVNYSGIRRDSVGKVILSMSQALNDLYSTP